MELRQTGCGQRLRRPLWQAVGTVNHDKRSSVRTNPEGYHHVVAHAIGKEQLHPRSLAKSSWCSDYVNGCPKIPLMTCPGAPHFSQTHYDLTSIPICRQA